MYGGDIDNQLKYEKISSYGAGIVYGIGFWCFLAQVFAQNADDSQNNVTFIFFLPGILATIALILINSIRYFKYILANNF